MIPHHDSLPIGSGPRIVTTRRSAVPNPLRSLREVRCNIALHEAATWLANLTKLSMGTEPNGRDYVMWDDLTDAEQDFYIQQVEKALQAILTEGTSQS